MQARSGCSSIIHQGTRLGHILDAYELNLLHTDIIDSRLE